MPAPALLDVVSSVTSLTPFLPVWWKVVCGGRGQILQQPARAHSAAARRPLTPKRVCAVFAFFTLLRRVMATIGVDLSALFAFAIARMPMARVCATPDAEKLCTPVKFKGSVENVLPPRRTACESNLRRLSHTTKLDILGEN